MKTSLLWISTAIGLSLLSMTASAGADIEFKAVVDRARATTATAIKLTLSVAHSHSISHFPAPTINLNEFEVSDQNEGMYSIETNGQATIINSWIYHLYARKAGRYQLGPARIEIEGKVYETEPVTVEVTRGRQSARASKNRESTATEGKLEDNLFIRAVPHPKRVYVGQQLTLAYDLCARYQIHDVAWKKLPSFSGFWVKDLFVAERLDLQQETIEQVQFLVWPLRRHALFPTSSGRHEIQALTISAGVPRKGGRRGGRSDAVSLFDNSLFGKTQTLEIHSAGVVVEAVPLPLAGRPGIFNGAVGSYAVSASAEPATLPLGDPVTLRVEIAGTGNIEAITAPALGEMSGFKVYEPNTEIDEGTENDLYIGKKSFEYILIPETSGRLRIPAVEFAFFDPQAAAYRTVRSEELLIESWGEEPLGEPSRYQLTRQEIEELGEDIRHIKPDVTDLVRGGAVYLHQSAWFWMLQALMPLAYVGAVLFHRHRSRLEGDEAYARRRRARGEARQRLKRAEAFREEGDSDAFCAEVKRAVLAFIADHLNRSAPGLSAEMCTRLLGERGVPAGHLKALSALLARCDFARFSSAATGDGEMAYLQDQAEEIIVRLEEVLHGI